MYEKLSPDDRSEIGMYMAEDTTALLALVTAGESYEAAGEACTKANGWTDAEYKRVASHMVYRLVEAYAATELENYGLKKVNLDAAYFRVPQAVRSAAEEEKATDGAIEKLSRSFMGELEDLLDVDDEDEDDFYNLMAAYLTAHENLAAGR